MLLAGRLAATRWDVLLVYTLPCIVLAFVGGSEPFRPVQILFQHVRILPAVLAPWTPPSSIRPQSIIILPWLARLLQWAVLGQCTTHMSAWLSAELYGVWWACVVLRTLVGFILTRSVGWAAPSFFSSRSGYEGSAGVGPLLIALEVDVLAGATNDTTRMVWIAALAVAERTPWTYAAASFIALLIVLGGQVWEGRQGYDAVDVETFRLREDGVAGDDERDDEPARPTQVANALAAVRRCTLRLAVCAVVGVLLYTFRPALPTLPSSSTPIAHLIILTSPRPRDAAQGDNTTLARTIASYTPFVTSLSVVTGFKETEHPAFVAAKAANPTLRFASEIGSAAAQPGHHRDLAAAQLGHYRDLAAAQPSHHRDLAAAQLSHHRDLAAAQPGHHRDLAGLLRWAQQDSSEWTMVIEDDFPLCGEWGWRGLQGVLATLELGRRRTPFAHAGWVGTGGSGLILHRTLLSANEQLLAEEANLPAKDRVPADLLVQMCSFGEDGRCADAAGGVVISDRMIMHHIGADDSSLGHDVGAGKYACGWRQPAHGREFVTDVIEV